MFLGRVGARLGQNGRDGKWLKNLIS